MDQINRGLDMAHLWIVNYIIHSWIDPVFVAAVMLLIVYGLWRALKWAWEMDK
jgi:hypothetical protein